MNDVGRHQKTATAIELPVPTKSRWQPLRLGLIELYHYDVQEFWFRDGHLLLRGNNGTGKSKVLSLTLPFLLDADLSASRVEPDGDPSKRMVWNLLMGKQHERRVGYTWLEFGRLDTNGSTHTLTLGCGLRAIAGRPAADPWFFITHQRIGRDVWLITPEQTVLSKERLTAALGHHGEVFPTAGAYRRAVDQQLFGLGPERYKALVNTLIQLRQPQLSKQPNEQRLSDALTESLSPLDQTALASVAEAMTELEDIHRRLDELEAMLKAVDAFGGRYERYAQVEVRRRARIVRQAQTEHDAASREVNEAAEESTTAAEQLKNCRAAEVALAADLATVSARLAALREDPRNIDAARIQEAVTRAGEAEQHLAQAQSRWKKLEEELEREVQAVGKRERASAQSGKQLTQAHSTLQDTAARCGVPVLPSPILGSLVWPDGAASADADTLQDFGQEAQALQTRRREQIGVLRKRLQELHQTEQELHLAQRTQRVHEEALDSAQAASQAANTRLNEACHEVQTQWTHHTSSLRVLSLENLDGLLELLERWTSTLDGPNPLKSVLDQAWLTHESRAAAELARIRAAQQQLEAQRTELRSEQGRLEQGEIRAPPQLPTRISENREGRVGAPLWKLVDFAANVSAEERARIEAALEGAGMLDAWVAPDGTLWDPLTQDALLVPGTPHPDSLDRWLIPTIPDEHPAAVSETTVTTLLRSIVCADSDAGDAQAWISVRGEYRLGTVRGAWQKPTAQYIGHTAREAARLQRLQQIAAELDEIQGFLATHEEEHARIDAARELALSEYQNAPVDDALKDAHAQLTAREQTRIDALSRLGEAQSKALRSRNAVERAQDALELDARDLALPTSAAELDTLERLLSDLRVQMQEFLVGIRMHQSTLSELSTQRQREQQTRSDFHAADIERQECTLTELSARETLSALRETIGKEVNELLGAIATAEAKRLEVEAAQPKARRKTETALATEAAAGQKHSGLVRRLDERVAARRRAMDELQSFATETGFIAVATPDISLPEGTQQWGVEAALTIARRAEQLLSDVRAEDADWQRLQREISNDLNGLQTSMSAQGHSATAETSQGCFIVRIIYQQQPLRPDALAQHLSTELKEQKLILSAREREILEEHLEKEIAANLQRMINETDALVESMNVELEARPTSTGVRFRLEWTPIPEDDEHGIVGLAAARRRLLKTSADAWSDEDRRELGAFLQRQIEAERQREDHGTVQESLSRALDYRRWHRFTVKRRHYGSWVALSGPASSGERALGLTVPLFAAASSHYESAAPQAPRLVLLDEAFAGIDDEARANCMGLIANFDLDFVMTSEREWGCYSTLPGLAICQIVRREGMDAVHVTRWTWDGHERVQQPDPTRRGPGPA